jgi:hypothetical protein
MLGLRYVLEALVIFTLSLVAYAIGAYLLLWIGMNMLLGCETWDQTRWTETKSCIPISHPVWSN